MIETEAHIYAFIASISTVAFMLFKHVNKVQNGKSTWKHWKSKQWDESVAAVFFPQILCFMYEGLFSFIPFISESTGFLSGWDHWSFFYDTYEGMNIVFGLFGVLIYTKLMKKGKDKIESL